MEILAMIAIGAAVLGLIWLIVREPKPIQRFQPTPYEVKMASTPMSAFAIQMAKTETAQEARVNAGIPRMPTVKPTKPVDTKPAKKYSSSTSGSSSSSSRSSDDNYSSYSSWGGDSGSSSSSSSCDSSSSSSSSCSSD